MTIEVAPKAKEQGGLEQGAQNGKEKSQTQKNSPSLASTSPKQGPISAMSNVDLRHERIQQGFGTVNLEKSSGH